VSYGDGQQERVIEAAGGQLDAMIDTFGDGYVVLALSLASKFRDLGVWSWPRRGRLRSCDFSVRV